MKFIPSLLTLAAGIASLSAQTTWNGGGADNNWSTSSNWSNGVPSNVTPGTAVVNFDGNTRLSSVVDANWRISSLNFLAGASSFNVGGANVLTLDSTGNAIVNNSSVLQTISTNLSIIPGSASGANVSQTFLANTGDLLITGNINGGNNRLIVNGGSGRTVTLAGTISGAGGSNGSLNTGQNVTPVFTLVLSGSNTFTGAANFLRGTVLLENNAALGNASSVSLGTSTGAAASLLTNGAYTIDRNITLVNGTNTNPTIGGNSAHASTFSGNVTLGGAGGRGLSVTAVSGGTVTFSGNLLNNTSTAGDGDTLTKTGAGTVILSGAGNTYTGVTTVSEGTLLINAAYSGAGGAISVSSNARLGGTATVNRAVNVAANGVLLAGDGTIGTTLTINSAVSLADNSVISLALGAGGTHSTLARAGGSWTFDLDQQFLFIDAGAQAGLYSNILTGMSLSQSIVDSWTIANSGWTGNFIYDSGNVSLNLSAVPEPGSVALIGLGLGLIGWKIRRRAKLG